MKQSDQVSLAMLKAIAVTAQLCGAVMDKDSARVMAGDLAAYSEDMVLKALTRCRREVKPGRFCLAEVLARIDDGHPGVESAWATVSRAADQGETLVWTEQMAQAYEQCKPLMFDGDMVAARMAFKEAYGAMLDDARLYQLLPAWSVTAGHDPVRRAMVLEQAVVAGQISHEQRIALCPPEQSDDEREVKARIKAGELLLGCDPKLTKPDGSPITVADRIAEIKALTAPKVTPEMMNKAARDALASRKDEVTRRVQAYAQEKGIQV